LAFIHMARPEEAGAMLARHGLAEAHHFSDPEGRLYRAFGLGRAGWAFLLDPRLWWRGLRALWAGHGLGVPRGDTLRLGGVFLLHQGRVVRECRLTTTYQRPDYLSLAGPPE
jgi:hypothetical protein